MDELSGENLEPDLCKDGLQRRKIQEAQADISAAPSGFYFGEEQTEKSEDTVYPRFDMFPEHLRIGPWSRLAAPYLPAPPPPAGPLQLQRPTAGCRPSSKPPAASRPKRCGPVSMYVAGVQAYVGYKFQWWPFLTYTCWSYALLNLHLLLHAVQLPRSAEILRFPVLAMATVTTFVWWLVLVPILVSLTEGKSRKEFIKLNFSFFLVNMHLFNFPLALAGHLLAPRKLVFADFWVAAVIAILYLLFYLLALDPRGVHLYIILTPRQWWCVLCYSGILGLYVGLFWIFS
ncbi:unnamed protein product [Effrenium voratum]|uniref:Uncharacterized protein n=1 Tax=Effrenium voratum TaxID=2562239 RepID=A0AA36INQ6_9DINO|nr:unnamed protein product [Effrenium voratum]CAJ1453817.1 unnamed protein product [Effrenium voratum]